MKTRTGDMLNDSEDGYGVLFHTLPESMLVFDTAGRIARFNEAAHLQLGYSRDEFARIGIREIDPFETQEGIRAKIRKILDNGTAEFNVKQRTKGGRLRDVQVISRVITLAGKRAISSVWRDVTELHKSLEAMKRIAEEAEARRARAEEIVASLVDAVSVQDTGFRILYQNRKSRGMIGSREGEPCYAAYEGRNRVCDGCPMAISFGDGESHTAVRRVGAGKGAILYEITTSAMKDAEGRIVAGIEVLRDVTEKRQAEDELRRRIDELGKAPQELIETIRRVYESGGYLGLPQISGSDFGLGTGGPDRILPHELLSQRELQVLRMIASGKTAGRIAEELSLSAKTVATFRSRILKKMRLGNNAQLVQYALRTRLID